MEHSQPLVATLASERVLRRAPAPAVGLADVQGHRIQGPDRSHPGPSVERVQDQAVVARGHEVPLVRCEIEADHRLCGLRDGARLALVVARQFDALGSARPAEDSTPIPNPRVARSVARELVEPRTSRPRAASTRRRYAKINAVRRPTIIPLSTMLAAAPANCRFSGPKSAKTLIAHSPAKGERQSSAVSACPPNCLRIADSSRLA